LLACGTAAELEPTLTPTLGAIPTRVISGIQPAAVPPAMPEDQSHYGGVIRIAEDDVGEILDPGVSGYGWSGIGLIGNLFSQLIRTDPRDRRTVEGDVAESWAVNQEGTAVVFKIRPGLIDHDGVPFTIDDVYYHIVRIVERPNGYLGIRQGCQVAYVKPVWDENGEILLDPGVEITGSNELTLRLRAPLPDQYLVCASEPWTNLVPSRITRPIDESQEGWRDLRADLGEVVGTGPFKLTNLERGNIAELERFEHYYREGLPYLDGIKIYSMPDPGTRSAAFISGNVDYLGLFSSTPSPLEVERIRSRVGTDEVKTSVVMGVGDVGWWVNVRKPPFGPVGDPKADNVRKAMQLTFNRQELNLLTKSGIGHIVPVYFIGWDWIASPEQWNQLLPGLDSSPNAKARDITEAKRLMTEAGYGPNNRLAGIRTISNENSVQDSDVLAANLREIWIDLQVVGVPTATRNERLAAGDFDLGLDSTALGFMDPDGFNTDIFLPWSESGRNFTGWENPRWRELFESQLNPLSQEERASILREMAQIWWNDALKIHSVRPGVISLYRSNIQGWTPPIVHTSNYTLEYVWLDPQ
jgi:peptide/nickel transport system substrate-binding protein